MILLCMAGLKPFTRYQPLALKPIDSRDLDFGVGDEATEVLKLAGVWCEDRY